MGGSYVVEEGEQNTYILRERAIGREREKFREEVAATAGVRGLRDV